LLINIKHIHAIWLIEEKLKIFLVDVWFIIIIAPTRAVITIIIDIKLLCLIIKIVNGAIFCHVSKITRLIHVNPSLIWGTQAWKGAIPVFIIRAIVIKLEEFILKKFIWFIIKDKIRMFEEIVWIKKYNNIELIEIFL